MYKCIIHLPQNKSTGGPGNVGAKMVETMGNFSFLKSSYEDGRSSKLYAKINEQQNNQNSRKN